MSNEKDLISLKLSEEMIMPVLEKQMQAAILNNIGDPAILLSKVIASALHQKVNKEGRKSQYSYENKFDFLDCLTEQAIQEAAKETLQIWLKTNKELIKKAVIAELNKPTRRKSIAKSFINAIEKSLECEWSMDCKIIFKEDCE